MKLSAERDCTMTDLHIITPGPLTTVQDRGRYGYLRFGVGVSGVMDLDAYQAANALVGNRQEEAVLEATLAGPVIEAGGPCLCAITGADMDAVLDGIPAPKYQSFPIQKGQRLALRLAKSGCRSYLAFQGGIQVPVVMGSRSTNLKCQLGGYKGRALQAGDTLALCDFKEAGGGTPRRLTPPFYTANKIIRVIEGPQADAFTETGRHIFYGTSYLVTPDSDRMGIRLDGVPVESRHGTDIISDGIVFGSIQVPPSGKPIVLMADHQTTGGYAKIATVCSFDLPLLAQARPGDRIQFVKITLEQAAMVRRGRRERQKTL